MSSNLCVHYNYFRQRLNQTEHMVSYIKNNNNNNVTDYDNNINNTDNIRLLPCSILLIILKIIILIMILMYGIGTKSYFFYNN